MTELQRIPLSTGVTLNVALAGDRSKPPVILLHGFPESHRTWREVAPRLQDHFYLVMPDQRHVERHAGAQWNALEFGHSAIFLSEPGRVLK